MKKLLLIILLASTCITLLSQNIGNRTAGDISLQSVEYPNYTTLGGIFQNDGYYTSRPEGQVLPFRISTVIVNIGSVDQTSVRFGVDVYNSSGTLITTETDIIPSLNAGNNDSLEVLIDLTNQPDDDYILLAWCDQAEGDIDLSNNYWDTIHFQINNNFFITRHHEKNDTINASGWGMVNGGNLGITFSIEDNTEIQSLGVFIDSLSPIGGMIIGQIYRKDSSNFQILQIQSEEYIISAPDLNSWIILSMIAVDPQDDDLFPGFRYSASLEIYSSPGNDIVIGCDNNSMHNYDIETFSSATSTLNKIPFIEVHLTGYQPPNNSINEIGNLDILLYPNPVKSQLTMNFQVISGVQTLSIFDMYGQLLQIISLPEQTREYIIDMSQYSIGTYSLELRTREATIRKKILKI